MSSGPIQRSAESDAAHNLPGMLSAALAEMRCCGECGYALRGLPPAGKCPECGNDYASDEIAIFGHAFGNRATPANAKPVRAILLLLIMLLAFAPNVAHTLDRALIDPRPIYLVPVLALAAVLGIHVYSWFAARSRTRMPSQLRLSSRGLRQRDGAGSVRLRPWSKVRKLKVIEAGADRVRIVISSKRLLPFPGDMASFEFRCNEEQATALTIQMNSWFAQK